MKPTIAEDSRLGLEKMLREAEQDLNARFAQLAEKVGNYGFAGKATLSLKVEIPDYDLVAKRKLQLGFKRL